MSYYVDKYKKYKSKYTELKHGGKLSYINELVKTSTVNGATIYEKLNSQSVIFTDDQRQTISNFVSIVLPNMTINNNKFTQADIDNVSVMGAGAFGVSIYVKNLLIKIIHVSKMSTPDAIIDEMRTLDDIFLAHSDSNPDRKYLSEYFGYLTANNTIGNELNKIDKHLQRNAQLHKNTKIHCNLTSSGKLAINATNIMADVSKSSAVFTNDVVFLFFDKALKDIRSYLSAVKSKMHEQYKLLMSALGTPNEPVVLPKYEDLKTQYLSISARFAKHMSHGIKYMHSLGYIHNDLKLENAVCGRETRDAITLKYQIIDFGLAAKLPTGVDTFNGNMGGTPLYFYNSVFSNRRSFLYDWHCLYIMILDFFSMVDLPASGKTGFVYVGKRPELIPNKAVNTTVNAISFPTYFSNLNRFLYFNIADKIDDRGMRIPVANVLLLLSAAQFIAGSPSLQSLNFMTYRCSIVNDRVALDKIYIRNIKEYENAVMSLIDKLPV